MEIVSHFNEKPTSRVAWWALGLGLGSLLVMPGLGIFASVIRPFLSSIVGDTISGYIGFGVGALALAVSIAAVFVGFHAIRRGELSWAVWLGFVPSTFVAAFWLIMLIGEFLYL